MAIAHIALYDKPEYGNPAVEKMNSFFEQYLQSVKNYQTQRTKATMTIRKPRILRRSTTAVTPAKR